MELSGGMYLMPLEAGSCIEKRFDIIFYFLILEAILFLRQTMPLGSKTIILIL